MPFEFDCCFSLDQCEKTFAFLLLRYFALLFLTNERIRRHNSKHKGFTGSKADWVLKYFEEYTSKSEALRKEKQIKNWKCRILLEKLICSKHPG
jgi:GIY-YIG catalytic domain